MERSQTELPHPLDLFLSRWLTQGCLQVAVTTSAPEEPSPPFDSQAIESAGEASEEEVSRRSESSELSDPPPWNTLADETVLDTRLRSGRER